MLSAMTTPMLHRISAISSRSKRRPAAVSASKMTVYQRKRQPDSAGGCVGVKMFSLGFFTGQALNQRAGRIAVLGRKALQTSSRVSM